MSLKTIGDIQTEFLVRNNLTTTDSFLTDQILKDWTNEAHIFCAGYKKWPFTEGRISTTFASLATNEDGYLAGSYPEGWKSDSIRLMTIGGRRVDKKNFYKFQQFVEDNPSANDRIFTDYNRIYYVNPRIDLSGTIAVWGQYTPVIDLSLPAEVTVFSNYDEEGNEAMVEKITAYLKRRENEPQLAEAHDARASAKLDEVATKIKDEQAQYQDTDNDGMFKRIDVVNGGFRDDIINRNQFN
jgi:hypothetical protein